MKNSELEQLINDKLNSAAISDFAPNGLQVEGRDTVHKIVTGVTASRALLDEAVRLQADAVIVHHGYFWKNESPVIRGMKRRRLKTLLANDINLYGWHLPLDAHPELGNNAQLAHLLGINVLGEIEPLVPRANCRCRCPASSWPRGLKRGWDASRCGAAIPGRTPSAASHGVPGRPELYRRRGALWRGRVYHRRGVGTNHPLCPRAGPAFLCRRPPRHRAGRHSRPQRMADGNHRPDVTFIDIPNPA